MGILINAVKDMGTLKQSVYLGNNDKVRFDQTSKSMVKNFEFCGYGDIFIIQNLCGLLSFNGIANIGTKL